PGARRAGNRKDRHGRRPSPQGDMAHRSDGARGTLHAGQCRPHLGHAESRVRRSARAASGAQAAFLRRAGGGIRAILRPLNESGAERREAEAGEFNAEEDDEKHGGVVLVDLCIVYRGFLSSSRGGKGSSSRSSCWTTIKEACCLSRRYLERS